MTREKANKIATDFFKDMNPSFWNGDGNKPESFREIPWEYPLSEDTHLEISMGFDDTDNEWNHYCDLVHNQDNASFDILSGYGIDSLLNLSDTIMDLCREYE